MLRGFEAVGGRIVWIRPNPAIHRPSNFAQESDDALLGILVYAAGNDDVIADLERIAMDISTEPGKLLQIPPLGPDGTRALGFNSQNDMRVYPEDLLNLTFNRGRRLPVILGVRMMRID